MAKKNQSPKQQMSQKKAFKRIMKELDTMDSRVSNLESEVGQLKRQNRDQAIVQNRLQGIPNKVSANEYNISEARVAQIIKQSKVK